MRFVEAMNLVDEENGALAHSPQPLGIGHYRFDFLDAAHTALKGMNSQRVTRAMSFASVVLPTPGGPQRMTDVN